MIRQSFIISIILIFSIVLFASCDSSKSEIEKLRHEAFMYEYNGKYDKAIEKYLEVIKKQKQILKNDEIDEIIYIYYDIANIYAFYKKDLPKGLEYYQKALHLAKQKHGQKSLNVVRVYTRIADAYTYANQYDKSLEYYLKVLIIEKELLPPNDLQIGETIMDIGHVYRIQGEKELGLELLLLSLKIANMHNEGTNELGYTVNCYIASIYDITNNKKLYNKYNNKCLELEKLLGKDQT